MEQNTPNEIIATFLRELPEPVRQAVQYHMMLLFRAGPIGSVDDIEHCAVGILFEPEPTGQAAAAILAAGALDYIFSHNPYVEEGETLRSVAAETGDAALGRLAAAAPLKEAAQAEAMSTWAALRTGALAPAQLGTFWARKADLALRQVFRGNVGGL